MNLDIDIERKKKKQKILAAYGAILLVVFGVIVLWSIPNPTCDDGKKNGLETGVDCGGVCGACEESFVAQDIVVQRATFVSSGNGKYDAVAWIENPNDRYGAENIEGMFVFYAKDRRVTGEIPTRSFILPGEKKIILVQGIETLAEDTTSVEWKSGRVTWVETNRITDLRLTLSDKKYEEVSSGVGFSKVSGLLTNNSLYDWNDAVVSIVLLDSSGNVLATHGTSRQTFRSGERWDFQLIFPERFPGVVYDVLMQAETNVYDNDNFLKANLPGGAFQSLGE